MKDSCSPELTSASPSPAVTLLKDKKKGRTFMVRKKWQDRRLPGAQRGVPWPRGDGGTSCLCQEQQGEDKARCGGP